MFALDCRHSSAGGARRVCPHLLEDRESAHYQRFTGSGLAFDLLCPACRPDPEPDLRTACPECFQDVRTKGSWEGIVGRPDVLERESGLSFRHETLFVAGLPRARFLDVRPVEAPDRNLWVALAPDGRLFRLDLDNRSAAPLGRVPGETVDLGAPVSLHLSRDGRAAAVVNTRGRHGVVFDPESGKTTVALDRGDYHNQHCEFPVAFCEVEGRLLLIHGTAWNRLDVSDPRTGELLTPRSPTSYRRGEERPEHYLDYFHCGLAVSPGQEHVADNGWVWSPWGVVTAWSVRRWLRENVWESEDGESRRDLCGRSYFWDGALCWVGPDRLAVWGYGDDEEWLLPAVRVFDVVSGREERWFPGPKGALAFDRHLFSWDESEGTSVWDAATGERLLRDDSLYPLRYHRGAKVFLTLRPDGTFRVSRLRGQTVDPGWLSGNDGVVARLVRAIQEERAFERLPILADALEEAGCDDAEILSHCREGAGHARNCWVLDLLSGKE